MRCRAKLLQYSDLPSFPLLTSVRNVSSQIYGRWGINYWKGQGGQYKSVNIMLVLRRGGSAAVPHSTGSIGGDSDTETCLNLFVYLPDWSQYQKKQQQKTAPLKMYSIVLLVLSHAAESSRHTIDVLQQYGNISQASITAATSAAALIILHDGGASVDVYFQAGIYTMNTTDIPFMLTRAVPEVGSQRLRFVGAGMDQTVLRFDGACDVISGRNVYRTSFHNMTFVSFDVHRSTCVVCVRVCARAATCVCFSVCGCVCGMEYWSVRCAHI